MGTSPAADPVSTSVCQPSALPASLGFALVGVLMTWLHWRLRCMVVDDAFIHLRIARNYALSGHPFFNGNERVMATSSPLWTMLLTGFDLWARPWVLSLAEGLLLTTCGALAYMLSKRLCVAAGSGLNHQISRLPPYHAFVSGCTMLVVAPSSIGGMETPLAIALLLGAMLSIAGKRIWVAPLLALAACTRLEVAPLFLVVFVIAVVRRWPRGPLAVAAVLVLSAAAWTFQQFGVLLPNAMRAKSIGYDSTRNAVAVQVFGSPVLEHVLVFCASVFLVCTLLQLLLLRGRREMSAALWLPLLSGGWGVVTALEYVSRRNPIFEWYLPLIWVPILLCLLLFPWFRQCNPWLTIALDLSRVACLLLLLILPLWKGSMLLRASWQLSPSALAEADHQDSARVRAYLTVGSALQRSCPTGSMMTSEIGALGWSFRGHIEDAFGIASPRAIHFQPLRRGAAPGGIPVEYVKEMAPDMIVSYAALDREVREDPAVRAQYQRIALPATLLADHVASLSGGWHKSTSLDVWLRRNGACARAQIAESLVAAFAPAGQHSRKP